MAWPLIIMAAGAALSAAGSITAAGAAEDAAKKNQIRLIKQAKGVRAGSHRRAYEMRKAGDQAAGRVHSLVAAQGGVTDDAGTTNIVGDIYGQSLFNAMSEIWQGDDQAQQLIETGAIQVDEAKGMKKAAYLQAAGSIMSAASSFGGGAAKAPAPAPIS